MMAASPHLLEENGSGVEALGGATLLSKPCTPDELAAGLVQQLGHLDPA